MQYTEDNRFFRLLWRFNALAIAASTLLVSVLAAYFMFEQYRFRTRDRQVTDVIRPNDNALTQDVLKLGQPMHIHGTSWIAVPLMREQSANISYYSKDSIGNQVNLYLAETSTAKGHWLLPDFNALIVSTVWLTADDSTGKANAERTVIGAVHEIVSQDSNGDGLISRKDRSSVAYTGVDGKELQLLVEGASDVTAIVEVSPDRFSIVYEQEGKSLAATYSSAAGQLVSQVEIPGVP